MRTQVRRQSRRGAGWIRRCVVVDDVGVVGGSYGESLVMDCLSSSIGSRLKRLICHQNGEKAKP